MAGESYAGHATSIRGLGARAEARAAGPTTLQRMRTIMESGEQRFVGKGSEYDQPYYRQTGVPGTYTESQQAEFSKLAQSLTYEDIGRGQPTKHAGVLSRALGTGKGKLSPQDLWSFLGEWKGEAGGSAPEHDIYGRGSAGLIRRGFAGQEQRGRQRAAERGLPYEAPPDAFGINRGRSPHPTTSAKNWGDPRDMVRQGANVGAAQAFREGTSGPPIAVDPFKGVDTRTKMQKRGKPSKGPAPTRTTEPGGAFSQLTSRTSATAEGQREGKRRAGKRYRRSRAGALTQQPTAGTILGDATGAGVLG